MVPQVQRLEDDPVAPSQLLIWGSLFGGNMKMLCHHNLLRRGGFTECFARMD